MNIHEEHSAMVAALAKSGESILASITPKQLHRIHMVIGYAGEVGEITEVLMKMESGEITNIKEAREALVEEFGDLIFYYEGYLQSFDVRPELKEFPRFGNHDPSGYGWQIAIANLLDATKREAIYQKAGAEEKIIEALKEVYKFHMFTMDALQITVEEVKEANLNKLLKGKNARYASGSYSDQQANERADKQ